MKVKTFLSPTLLMSLVILLGLNGCGGLDSNEIENAALRGEEQAFKTISDEIAHQAYDATFILSFAAVLGSDEEESIVLEEDGNTTTYIFNDTHYLSDESPNTTAKGTMRITKDETSEYTEASFTISNDPKGLKTIAVKSLEIKGSDDLPEGGFVINGAPRTLEDFKTYIEMKLDK